MSITPELDPVLELTRKKKEKAESQFFYWTLLLTFVAVIVCACVYIIRTWKDPPVMFPLVDLIDIGRHNDKPGVKFTRGKNSIFYVKLKFKSSSRMYLALRRC